MRELFDVVVVGGAVVGSAAAYFLADALPPGARVLVLEADPTYAHCATTRSLASIRHQFSTRENIRLSMFGTRFMREAPQRLAVAGQAPPLVGFVEAGYLFLATEAGRLVAQANHAVQSSEGAQVVLLSPGELAARFPWLAVDDLALGSLGLAGEGWVDGHGLLHALRRKAVSMGVQYRAQRAVGFVREGARVTGVRTESGQVVGCGHAINAAGTGATTLALTAGIELPVQPRKRIVVHFRSPATVSGPLVIDPTGMYFRPEGQGFLCGVAPAPEEDPPCEDFDVPATWFEDRLWPLLARRVPGFEAARVVSTWAGHYDVNVLDHNAVLGPHPQVANLLFANGFSGHGLQHAPGVGRALAEWVVHGRSTSLDLSALGFARVLENRPLPESNVV